MFNYFKFKLTKKKKNVIRERFCYYACFKNKNSNFFAKICMFNSFLEFKKRSIFLLKKKKTSERKRLSVCSLSGRYRSQIHKLSFKRHTIKKLLTENLIPNIVKKIKIMLLNFNFINNVFLKKSNIKIFLINTYFIFPIPFYPVSINVHQLFKWVCFSMLSHYKKFTFVGKTYKILFKSKKLKMIFNRGHKTYLYFNKFFLIKKRKKRFFKIKFFLFKDVGLFFSLLKIIRRQSLYTLRGIKLSRTKKFKKPSKKKSYR